jgi:hypothetical protein
MLQYRMENKVFYLNFFILSLRRWVANREMVAKLFARLHACYGSFLGSKPDITQRYKMGDISKGLTNTL